MFRAISSSRMFSAIMFYYILSFFVILIASINSLKSRKTGTKSLQVLYIFYLFILACITLWPIHFVGNKHLSNPYFLIIFVVMSLFLFILSIVILKTDKGTDKAKKTCFAFIILNIIVGTFFFYLVVENSEYQYVSNYGSVSAVTFLTDLISPDTKTHEYNEKNKKKFVGSCLFNLPANVSNIDLYKKIDINVSQYKSKSPNTNQTQEIETIIQKIDNGIPEYQEQFCKGYYDFFQTISTS